MEGWKRGACELSGSVNISVAFLLYVYYYKLYHFEVDDMLIIGRLKGIISYKSATMCITVIMLLCFQKLPADNSTSIEETTAVEVRE